jgi:hypothetical protein
MIDSGSKSGQFHCFNPHWSRDSMKTLCLCFTLDDKKWSLSFYSSNQNVDYDVLYLVHPQ